MTPIGIRTKLTIAYSSVLAVVLVGFGVLAYRVLEARLQATTDNELEELSAGLRGYLRLDDEGVTIAYDPEDAEQSMLVQRATRYVQLVDVGTGRVLLQSPAFTSLGMRPFDGGLPRADRAFRSLRANGTTLRFHTAAFHDEHGRACVLGIGVPMDQSRAALDELRNALLITIPAGILFAGMGGWWMAGLVLRPLKSMRNAAHDINISHLDRRLPLSGAGDELDRLARTFNDVFERLEQAVQRMRQFAAAASHELRTPLVVLRGEAEVTLLHGTTVEEFRRVMASQLEEYERLTRLVNQLLTLALADAGEIHLQRAPFDLAGLLRRLVDDLRPVAESEGVDLQLATLDPVIVDGDERWVERAALNLLDNGLKYTPAGGTVRATVARSHDDALLVVRDTGVGMSAEEQRHVFDRFFRGRHRVHGQSQGAGIGLSLVQWIVRAHGGQVTVESQVDRGSSFTVRLPGSTRTSSTRPAHGADDEAGPAPAGTAPAGSTPDRQAGGPPPAA